MRYLTEKDTANRDVTVNAEANSVSLHSAMKPHKGKQRVEMRWEFNFANCTNEHLLELASQTVRQMVQKDWRDLEDAEQQTDAKAWHNVTFDVADILSKRTKRTSSFTKTANAVAQLSPEQFAELKAMYEAREKEQETNKK